MQSPDISFFIHGWNRKQGMAAGHRIDGVAGRNFSAAEFVHALMDCSRALAGGVTASAPSRHAAASGRGETAAGQSLTRISAGLRLRNSVVLRKLLLDLQHHEAIWRDQWRGCCR